MKVHNVKRMQVALAGVALGMLLPAVAARGQSNRQSSTGMSTAQQASPAPSSSSSGSGKATNQLPALDPDGSDPMLSRLEEQQSKSRNADRQRRLQSDTEKLLSLATELKQQVDKTDKNILSVDVIRKADEIEKLAKSVKDRMKG